MSKGIVNKIKKMSKIEIGESPNPIVGILETCPPLAENSFPCYAGLPRCKRVVLCFEVAELFK